MLTAAQAVAEPALRNGERASTSLGTAPLPMQRLRGTWQSNRRVNLVRNPLR